MHPGRAGHAVDRGAAAADRAATVEPPTSPLIGRVLALQRQAGNRATARALSRLEVLVPPFPPLDTGSPTTPELSRLARPGYVFLMGDDAPFKSAQKYYEKYRSGATVVTGKKSFGDILEYIRTIPKAAGEIYIITHGAEDGTMYMGLKEGETTGHVTPKDLAAALDADSLPTPGYDKVDDATQIHIRGCNIGRTKKMVDLIDQAFNGYARVDASTHEVEYGYSGDDAYQEFGGPLLDKAGSKLYKQEELVELLKNKYPHLPEAKVNELARQLAAKDPRSAQTIADDRTYGQHGQRVDVVAGGGVEFDDPQTVAEAARVWKDRFRASHFTPDTPTKDKPDSAIVRRKESPSGETKVDISHEIDGTLTDGTPRAFTDTVRGSTVDSDAVLLAEAKKETAKPEAYEWRIKEDHDAKSSKTTRKAVGERVIAYLHHGSLDAKPGQHFFKLGGEDPTGEYYARSTYQPKLPEVTSAPGPLPPGGNPFPPSRKQ